MQSLRFTHLPRCPLIFRGLSFAIFCVQSSVYRWPLFSARTSTFVPPESFSFSACPPLCAGELQSLYRFDDARFLLNSLLAPPFNDLPPLPSAKPAQSLLRFPGQGISLLVPSRVVNSSVCVRLHIRFFPMPCLDRYLLFVLFADPNFLSRLLSPQSLSTFSLSHATCPLS